MAPPAIKKGVTVSLLGPVLAPEDEFEVLSRAIHMIFGDDVALAVPPEHVIKRRLVQIEDLKTSQKSPRIDSP